ncbi:hypothetical protein [Roseomonas sp. BN140053]|uniref:hypothetical protein n=1 Tax=Roseomonas sp. BN140053 TaxID=3391898 RepID=UPI0039ECF41C
MRLVLLAAATLPLLAGCQRDAPMERTGAALDRAGTRTGEAVGRAANNTGAALGRAGNWVDRKLNPE